MILPGPSRYQAGWTSCYTPKSWFPGSLWAAHKSTSSDINGTGIGKIMRGWGNSGKVEVYPVKAFFLVFH